MPQPTQRRSRTDRAERRRDRLLVGRAGPQARPNHGRHPFHRDWRFPRQEFTGVREEPSRHPSRCQALPGPHDDARRFQAADGLSEVESDRAFCQRNGPSNLDKQSDKQEQLPVEPDTAEAPSWILSGRNRQLPTYQPPVFSNNPAVFYDLVSYAPAMRTNLADVLAVLEAEAPVDSTTAKPGKIDDRARRLIERARGAGWQTATIADPHGKTPLTVAFDGTGRYRYERTTSAGLREQVVCDGTSLWHLYPELGIGARRTLSRFHRQDFARLVPWALPPAEDLAHDADLVVRRRADRGHRAAARPGERRGRRDASPEGASVPPAKGEALAKTFARTSSSPPTAGWPNGSWSRCLRARFSPARATGRTERWSSSRMKRKKQAGRPHHNGRSGSRPAVRRS